MALAEMKDETEYENLALEGYAYAFDETVGSKDLFTGYYNQLLVQKSMLG